MLKIITKLEQQYDRYMNKSTLSGQHRRCINNAKASAVFVGSEFLRMAHWGSADFGIVSFIGTLGLQNFKNARNISKALKPIKQRAKSIYG